MADLRFYTERYGVGFRAVFQTPDGQKTVTEFVTEEEADRHCEWMLGRIATMENVTVKEVIIDGSPDYRFLPN